MKTLKEFDYDLWTTNEAGRKKYFARVKNTGEVTEISLEVRRYLMSQEKQLRRERMNQDTELSLEAVCEDIRANESLWLFDAEMGPEDKVLLKRSIGEFIEELTPNQRDIFQNCMINGVGLREYARSRSLNHKSLCEASEAIRKKLKKFF